MNGKIRNFKLAALLGAITMAFAGFGVANVATTGGFVAGNSIVAAAAQNVATVNGTDYATLQEAIDAAQDGDTIVLVADVTEDVLITQKADVDLVIDGNDKSFTGVMTVFGDARHAGAETLTIKNINFYAVADKDSCIVSPDRTVYNRYSYSHNVTVDSCNFYGNVATPHEAAAVRHEDGGDKNWTIINCTVDENMHSMLQVQNVNGKLVVDGCTVNSKNGLNLNSCTNVEITNCDMNVNGYAVRAGVKTGGDLAATKTFVLENNVLKSECNDGDAVVMFRASSTNTILDMSKNVVSGTTHINSATADIEVAVNGNYWDGEEAPVVVVGGNEVEVEVDSYYADETLGTLVPNPRGSVTPAYTRADGFWGEGKSNANESYVVEIYENGVKIVSASLNDIGNIMDGTYKNVTWSVPFAGSTDQYWTVQWATNYPRANMYPDTVKLVVDGEVVSTNSVQYNAPDNLNEIEAFVEDNAGGVVAYTKLADAFAAMVNGNEVAIVRAGTYALSTAGKDITITGAVDGVVFDNIGKKNMSGANVTFNNITFDYYPNVNYTGLQHSGNLVYNDCTFNGQVFLYGISETFNDCTFNQNDAGSYNVWTYAADVVEFNGCAFNCVGKSVLVYTEDKNAFTELEIKETTFNASAPVDGKAAIEIDTSLTKGANITIDKTTTANGFAAGSESNNTLWNNKKGSDEGNKDITIVVGDETVLAPTAKIGKVGYSTLAEAFAAAQAGDTIEIMAGEYSGNLDVKKAITVVGETNADGNLVTIKGKLNVTANGAIVKNINVDNGSSTAGYINANDVVIDGCNVKGGNGFRYCYTKGTVTFKNCVITGSTYGIHFDGSAGGNIVIDNCTITGWTSFAGTITNVSMKDTHFAEGNYNYIRFYQDATIDGCTFESDDMGIDIAADDATLQVKNVENIEQYLDEEDILNKNIIVNNEQLVRVASIGKAKYETLAKAFNAAKEGDEVIIFKAGTYKLDTYGKDITITANIAGVEFNDIGRKNIGSANITFNNITFDYSSNIKYYGLKYGDELVYNNCTFNGQVFLYGESEIFNNCTFNQNDANAYNVCIYNAKAVEFNGCTFNCAGESVLVNSNNQDRFTEVVVNRTTFNATAPIEGKAAIEIDASLMKGVSLTIDDTTVANGFALGNNSNNTLWNNKKALENGNNIQVVVGGVTVLESVLPPDNDDEGDFGYGFGDLAGIIGGLIGAGDIIGSQGNAGSQVESDGIGAAGVVAIVAGSLAVVIAAGVCVLWILEKKEIFKVSEFLEKLEEKLKKNLKK